MRQPPRIRRRLLLLAECLQTRMAMVDPIDARAALRADDDPAAHAETDAGPFRMILTDGHACTTGSP